MSSSSGDSASGSEKKTESTATRGSSGTKKSVEEHFGSEVDVKIRSGTSTAINPKVEKYFGSEVDLKLTAEKPSPLAPIQDVDDAAVVSSVARPKKVDLAALDAKPFKDATDKDSIRKLEAKLEEVKEEQKKVEDEADDAGRKMSALFLAKAGEEGDKKKAEGADEERKKTFLDKMRTKATAAKHKEEAKKEEKKADTKKEEKLFEKKVSLSSECGVSPQDHTICRNYRCSLWLSGLEVDREKGCASLEAAPAATVSRPICSCEISLSRRET